MLVALEDGDYAPFDNVYAAATRVIPSVFFPDDPLSSTDAGSADLASDISGFSDFTLQTLAAVPMIGYCMCGKVGYPLYWFGAGKIDLVTVFPFFITMIIFRAQQPDLTDSDAPGYVFQKCAPENASWCLDLLNEKGQIGMGIVIVLVLRMLRVVKTLRFTREDRLEIVLKKQCYFSTHVARMTAIGISMFLGYFTFFASLMYLLEVEVEQLFVVIHHLNKIQSSDKFQIYLLMEH